MPKKMKLSVVGLRHRLTVSTMHELEEELPIAVAFEREPDNDLDANAIKVVIADPLLQRDGMHIGYLRRELAAEFAPMMDSGTFDFIEGAMTDIDAETGIGELEVKARTVKKAS